MGRTAQAALVLAPPSAELAGQIHAALGLLLLVVLIVQA
jgi:hypothetical protein